MLQARHSRGNRLARLRWAIPVVLGFLYTMGDGLTVDNGRLPLVYPPIYLRFVVITAVFCVAFWAVDRTVRRLGASHATRAVEPDVCAESGHRAGESGAAGPHADRESRPAGRVARILARANLLLGGLEWARASFLRCWMAVFACWLPYVAGLYPGIYWSDTSQQLVEYYGGEVLTDHHPYLTTLVFGWFSDLGKAVSGHATVGLYALVLLQALAASAMLAALVLQVRRYGAPRWAAGVLLGFFALFPLMPIMYSSVAKDMLSTVFFMGFVLAFNEVALEGVRRGTSERAGSMNDTGGSARSDSDDVRRAARGGGVSLGLFVALVVFGILAALTRKTMGYVIVPALLFLLLLPRAGRAVRTGALGSALAVALVTFVVVPKLVLPAMGVAPGGRQEAIAVLIQQVAHDAVEDGENMSEADRQLWDDFIVVPYDQLPQRYDFQIADAVKGRSVKDDSLMGQFLGLWARKTVENPLGHFEAWLGLTHGWFGFRDDDGTPGYLEVYTGSDWLDDDSVYQYVDWPTRRMRNVVLNDFYDYVESIPVLNLVFFRATWATLLPGVALFVALGARGGLRRRLALLMPALITVASLMMVPVSGFGGEPTRYVLPLVCTLPMTFVLVALERRRA